MALCIVWPLSAFAGEQLPGQAYNLNAADQKQFNALSEDQRRELLMQSDKKWQSMSAEEKKSMEEQARSDFSNLTAEQQQKMKSSALKQWQNMSPEEQQEMRSTFPDLLKGNLELDPGS